MQINSWDRRFPLLRVAASSDTTLQPTAKSCAFCQPVIFDVGPHGTRAMPLDQPASTKELTARYELLLSSLRYAVHELPAGVLYGKDGATEKQCSELIADLHEFERLCRTLNREHRAFIEGCSWHFEHYPHYLGRRRHFRSYQEYVEGRNGPLRVEG